MIMEKTKLYYIELDGKFTWGINSKGIFRNEGDAKKALTNKFKNQWYMGLETECKKLSLKSATEYREYLEKQGRLIYPIIEL